MSIYKDNILQNSAPKNLIRDINNGLIKYNSQILNIEYIPEQKFILFFFDNGLITIYSINNNEENIYINESIIEYEDFINLNENEDNQYTYYNLNIYKSNYLCENIIKEEMDIENNINNINSTYFTTFLIICANQKNFNKKKSTIYFLKIENSKFISLNDNDSNIKYNKIGFDNKEIINASIFKYKINNEENDMSDYIFVLFKQTNNLNNNKFLYSTEFSNLFHWFKLDKKI